MKRRAIISKVLMLLVFSAVSVVAQLQLNRLNVNVVVDGDSLRIIVTDGTGTGQGNTEVTIDIPGFNKPIVVITRFDGTVTIPLDQLPGGKLHIDVIARKPDFVDGKGTEIITNNALRLPQPSIFYLDPNGNRIPANQASVPTNGRIIVVFDYGTITSEEMRNKAHDLIATLTYGGAEIERQSVKTTSNGAEIIFELNGKTNSENAAVTTITVAGWAVPNPETFFVQSHTTTATFNLSRLVVTVSINDRPVSGGGTATGANGDVLMINVRDNQGNIRPNADVLITINGTQTPHKTDANGNVRISFEELPRVTTLIVSVFVREPGFVNSLIIPFTIMNNTDHDAPKIESAHFAFGGYLSNDTRDKDTLTVKFDELIWWENRSTHLINLWDKDGKLYIMTLTPISGNNGSDLWKFVVESIEGDYRPASGDSVNINHIAEVRDRWSNYVEEGNPKRPFIEQAASITTLQKSDNRHGIRFATNPVFDKAEISVVLPNNERAIETKIAIYDITGNVVFSTTARDNVSWDLTNTAGRFVANGTYLVIVEVKDRNGRTHTYSARLGVKR